jgi:predicted RecA/RadA family phage recombinase
MAQLTAPRSTNAYGRVPGVNVLPQTFYLPMAASTTIYQGALVTVNSSGYAIPAVSGTAGTVVGRCAAGPGGQSTFTSVAAASQYVTVEQGCFMWNNPDPLTFANFGAKVYATSDNSVSATAGSNAAAGYFVGLDSATSSQAMVITILGAFGVHT